MFGAANTEKEQNKQLMFKLSNTNWDEKFDSYVRGILYNARISLSNWTTACEWPNRKYVYVFE